MFRLASLALVVLSSSSLTLAAEQLLSQDFVLWTTSFNKQYESDEEAKRAFETWQANDGKLMMMMIVMIDGCLLLLAATFCRSVLSLKNLADGGGDVRSSKSDKSCLFPKFLFVLFRS
jgi:hypothetical protein